MKIFSKDQNDNLLVLVSATCLFLELAVIRYQALSAPVLAIFKNVSLLSCFLGIGVGFARSKISDSSIGALPFGLFVVLSLLHALDYYAPWWAFGNPVAEQQAMGLNLFVGLDKIPSLLFMTGLFLLNAMLFLPLGQLMGSLMDRSHSPHLAYRWNLLGSLIGIAMFTFFSGMNFGPTVWFGAVMFSLSLILHWHDKLRVSQVCLFILTMGGLSLDASPRTIMLYSPYNDVRLNFYQGAPPILVTNGLYYQKILDLGQGSKIFGVDEYRRYYNQPYQFVNGSPEVLVVGSGTGNDVAAALRNGASKVTAVEIDPVILRVGQVLHPENPYASKNVTTVLNDARNYIRYSKEQFDLIVYGLLDSHTMLSGRSGGLRLDSYVYTVEAFREARARLKPGGVISISFAFSDLSSELIDKLYVMLKTAFDGREPLVLCNNYDYSLSFLISDKLESIGQADIGRKIDMSSRAQTASIDPSTDKWPFLYMPRKALPMTYVLMSFVLLAVSIFFLRWKVGRTFTIVPHPFFLGAGFMLIETKAITELTLHFGAVYTVVAATIFSILILALVANEVVMKTQHVSSRLCFALLLGSIALSYIAQMSDASYLEHASSISRPILLVLPLFFAGLCFSRQLEKQSTGSTFASNLLGAMVGAVLEYSSMYFGFGVLYLLAALLYALAFLSSGGVRPASDSVNMDRRS